MGEIRVKWETETEKERDNDEFRGTRRGKEEKERDPRYLARVLATSRITLSTSSCFPLSTPREHSLE